MSPEANVDNAWKVIVITTICLLTSIIMVCLRFYVRRIILRSLGPDDWFLAASLVCALTLLQHNPLIRLALIHWMRSYNFRQ
jgi:hypothetical protein